MLVLCRKVGQRLLIGDDIIITVVGNGKTVRLGVTAPKSISVHRQEVYDAIQAAKAKAEADEASKAERPNTLAGFIQERAS